LIEENANAKEQIGDLEIQLDQVQEVLEFKLNF
jgi:hypothetical protein